MKIELIKFLLRTEPRLDEFNIGFDKFTKAFDRIGNYGEITEIYYSLKLGIAQSPKNQKGYDLVDGTEIKQANQPQLRINIGETKRVAKRIIMIANDFANKRIIELTVTPDEIKNVDGSMPNKFNLGSKETTDKFGDRIKVLATY